MKKLSYIVLGGMLVFAACQPNNTQDAAKIQHTIDSTAAELAKPEIEKMQKACDDEIMTAAMDSAKVIMEHAKKGAAHHTVKPAVKKVETKPATVGNGKPSMTGGNTNSTTVGNGKPSMTTSNTNTKSNGTTVGNGKPKM